MINQCFPLFFVGVLLNSKNCRISVCRIWELAPACWPLSKILIIIFVALVIPSSVWKIIPTFKNPRFTFCQTFSPDAGTPMLIDPCWSGKTGTWYSKEFHGSLTTVTCFFRRRVEPGRRSHLCPRPSDIRVPGEVPGTQIPPCWWGMQRRPSGTPPHVVPNEWSYSW